MYVSKPLTARSGLLQKRRFWIRYETEKDVFRLFVPSVRSYDV